MAKSRLTTVPATETPAVENTIPVLGVKDVQASIRFYRDKLNFRLDWGGEGDTSHIASVSRDGHAIMLQKSEKVSPTIVWIGGPGMLPLYEQCKTNGVKILQPPTNQYYALEMRLEDPDGHVLWFGAESRTDTPFGQRPADLSMPPTLKHAVPTLPVTDAAKAQAYYVDVLGFKREFMINDSHGVPHFCGVSRDGVRIYLSTVDVTPDHPFRPGDLTLATGSKAKVDALFAEFKAKGAKIKREPRDVPWGREFILLDPDDNAIVVGIQ